MLNNLSPTFQLSQDGWLIIHDLDQTVESSSIESVLDLMVSLTGAQCANVYWSDPAAIELRLIQTSPAPEENRMARLSSELSASARAWVEGLRQPEAISGNHPYFAGFPENTTGNVNLFVVYPLRSEGRVRGLVTLQMDPAEPMESSMHFRISKLGDALTMAVKEQQRDREVELLREKLRHARNENSQLEKRLAERKLVERAKGILQTAYGWSEEECYYHIRRTSRQQRTPMVAIAQRIIDTASARQLEQERLTA